VSHPSSPVPPSGYGYPPAGPVGHATHPSRGTATAAVWAAALGFLCFPVLGSIVGIVLGRSAERAGYPGGRARVAVVLGWVGLVLAAAGVAVQAFGWLADRAVG
jgi:hypothetical protein